jgi:acyl-CoA thioesterase
MTTEPDTARDELAEACADAMWAEDAASQALGIELEEVKAGYARARMRVTDSMINGHAVCHGGYVFLLADTAFAFACNTDGAVTLASACDIVFVAPAHVGDELVAEARERTRFGRNGVYDVTVRGRDGSVVAEFRGHSRTTDRKILDGEG